MLLHSAHEILPSLRHFFESSSDICRADGIVVLEFRRRFRRQLTKAHETRMLGFEVLLHHLGNNEARLRHWPIPKTKAKGSITRKHAPSHLQVLNLLQDLLRRRQMVSRFQTGQSSFFQIEPIRKMPAFFRQRPQGLFEFIQAAGTFFGPLSQGDPSGKQASDRHRT